MQTFPATSALPDPRPAIFALPARGLRARLQAALGTRFIVERELGGGAMSTVFQARERTSGLRVAVKLLADPDADERARIRREALVTARLHHPNVLPLIDAGEDAGIAYLVTPFVDGGSLRDRLDERGPLPAMEVVRMVHALAVALAHAHAHGVVHGDVKPENVLLDGEHVLLADFGAARLRTVPWRTSANGVTGNHPAAASPTMGTPRYMSPEQALGDPHPDPRSDIYSLAAVAVELLTGRPPFSGPTTRAVLLAHLSEPAPSLVARAGVPLQLARILEQSLQKQPADRPASAAAVAAALAPLLERPTLIPFAPALASTTAQVAAARRAGRLAAMAGTVTLGAATFAAAALLIISAAAPLPDGIRIARGITNATNVTNVTGGPLGAAIRCGAIRTVDDGPTSPRARA